LCITSRLPLSESWGERGLIAIADFAAQLINRSRMESRNP
jgi:hypothetical protein